MDKSSTHIEDESLGHLVARWNGTSIHQQTIDWGLGQQISNRAEVIIDKVCPKEQTFLHAWLFFGLLRVDHMVEMVQKPGACHPHDCLDSSPYIEQDFSIGLELLLLLNLFIVIVILSSLVFLILFLLPRVILVWVVFLIHFLLLLQFLLSLEFVSFLFHGCFGFGCPSICALIFS